MSTNFTFGFRDDDTNDSEEQEESPQAPNHHEKSKDIFLVPPQSHTLHEIVGPMF